MSDTHPTSTSIPIQFSPEALEALCRRHRIERMALFGSVLREDFTPESDVDVLVEFAPGVRLTLFDLAGVENELADLFGRRVDLHEARSLHGAIRDRVLQTARQVYVAA